MKRDIELLFEIGALRHMQRQWYRFGGVNFANNAEHMYRVAWIALIIASREGVTNTDKVLKMALAHDIAESRTGDVDYISRQYVKRDEKMALEDMLEATSIAKEFLDILEEYEKRESIEARIVKDADNLDVDMELREQAANGVVLAEVFSPKRQHVAKTKLYTDTAREIYAAMQESGPHDWHLLSPHNRVNGGDWKK